MDENVLELMWW